jgi:glycosyltransferase involved in cell wall biosynthesis
MPVYNAERYVSQAVESILGQTFRDFELLIVDDGSTDGSQAILERFAAADSRIKLVRQPNQGCLVALNEMVGRSRGELLARMDADDVAMPERFERQVAYLDEHPECVAVGSRVQIIDPDGQPLTVMTDLLTHEQIDQALLSGNGAAMYHPSVVIRKQALEEVGRYRDEYYLCEDLDLFLRLAEVGRLANLAEPLLRYREHLAKVGQKRVVQQNANARKAVVEAHRRRGLASPAQLPARIDRVRSKGEVYQTWSWWALGSGYLRTARKYAAASLVRTPFSRQSWTLLLCTIRGR